MAFLVEPLIARPSRNVADLSERIQLALRDGLSVIVLADSPAGETAARSRFRLEAFEAAAAAAVPLNPLWRGASGFTLGPSVEVSSGDTHVLEQQRDQLRSALGGFA
jgi:hypothetical protein